MSSLKEFQCEICGIVSDNPIHWFVIECGDQKLAVIKWDVTAANSPTARHFCGEASDGAAFLGEASNEKAPIGRTSIGTT